MIRCDTAGFIVVIASVGEKRKHVAAKPFTLSVLISPVDESQEFLLSLTTATFPLSVFRYVAERLVERVKRRCHTGFTVFAAAQQAEHPVAYMVMPTLPEHFSQRLAQLERNPPRHLTFGKHIRRVHAVTGVCVASFVLRFAQRL